MTRDQGKSVLTDADHIYAKAAELYNATEWPLDTWGAVHVARPAVELGRADRR